MLQIKNILEYIIAMYFNINFRKATKKDKRIVRNNILKSNPNFKRLQFKKGYVLKINMNNVFNIKIDYSSFKNPTFEIITFKELLPLYNEKYFKNNKYFNNIKDIKLIPFIKYDYDIAYMYLILFNEMDYKKLLNCFNKINSWSYKANFTTKERKLLYKLKNKEYYSSIAITDENYSKKLMNKILNLEQAIQDKEIEIQDLKNKINDFETTNKTVETFFKNVKRFNLETKQFELVTIKFIDNIHLLEMNSILQELELDLMDLNQELQETNNKYDNYITSIDFNQENLYKVNYIPTSTNKNFKRYEYY